MYYIKLTLLVIFFTLSCSSPIKLYKKAISKNTIDSYNKYLIKYPNSEFADSVKIKLENLKRELAKKEYENIIEANLDVSNGVIYYNISTNKAREIVKTVFQNNNIGIESATFMGMELDSDSGPVSGSLQKDGKILIVRAKPNKDGEYLQPVISMGLNRGFYVYKAKYTASFDSKKISITKSEAFEESPTRKDVPVEEKILKEIEDLVVIKPNY